MNDVDYGSSRTPCSLHFANSKMTRVHTICLLGTLRALCALCAGTAHCLSRVILEGVVCHPPSPLDRPAKRLAGLAMWRYVCEKPGRPPLRYGGRPTSASLRWPVFHQASRRKKKSKFKLNFKLKLVLQ